MNGTNNPMKKPFSWLLVFFGLAYFCQFFGQAGLLNQPLTFYFKEVLGFKADEVATFFAMLTIPWMIKPLYGLISDYFPLLGYRRKSYLLILNLVAVGGFLSITGMTAPTVIQMALLLASFCTAFSDVAIDGLMVELGRKEGRTAEFQSIQWLFMNVAAVLSSLAGGFFTQYLGATVAFKVAAGVTAVFPMVLVVASWLMVREERATVDRAQLAETTRGLWNSLRSKTLWIVIGFLAFWQFSPSFGTPMFYHMTDTLKFSQEFIGTVNAVGGVAAVIGALLFFWKLAGRYSTTTLLYWSASLGVVGTLSYLLLVNPETTGTGTTAIVLALVFGVTAQVAQLTMLNLAAESCQKRVEALTFAVLMSVWNLAAQAASIFGAWLFENVFVPGWQLEWLLGAGMAPLIIVSAVFTLLCLPLIRFLPPPVSEEGDESGTTQG